jgi:polysaccharide deacetylase 2 family uncharacterized protein YibQ
VKISTFIVVFLCIFIKSIYPRGGGANTIVSVEKPKFTADERYLNQRYLPAKQSKPKFSVIIMNYGLDQTTEDILEKLPSLITLAVNPYAEINENWIKKATASGFMLLAQIPIMSIFMPGRIEQTAINMENMKMWKDRLGASLGGYILESGLHEDSAIFSRIIPAFKGTPIPVWVPQHVMNSSFLQVCEENNMICGVGDIQINGSEVSEIEKLKYDAVVDIAKKTGHAILCVRLTNQNSLKVFLDWLNVARAQMELVSIKEFQLTPKSIPDIFEKDEKK